MCLCFRFGWRRYRINAAIPLSDSSDRSLLLTSVVYGSICRIYPTIKFSARRDGLVVITSAVNGKVRIILKLTLIKTLYKIYQVIASALYISTRTLNKYVIDTVDIAEHSARNGSLGLIPQLLNGNQKQRLSISIERLWN